MEIIAVADLKVGMFVAEPDCPWTDLPFLLQGFIIAEPAEIDTFKQHCQFVYIDRAFSTGEQFRAAVQSATVEFDRYDPRTGERRKLIERPYNIADERLSGYLGTHNGKLYFEEREALQGGRTALVLCFKGAGTLSREEIETEIDAELFAKLEHLIGKPLIHKERRGYRLPGGLTLEVNCVDPDLPTAFWYAEVEFETEAQALAWDPAAAGLADYLHDECTGKPGSSMGEYWLKTRK